MSNDGERLFTGSWDRHMKEWNPNDQTLTFDWGKVHNSDIWSMDISSDNENIFTAGFDKHIKQWSISQHCLVKDFG